MQEVIWGRALVLPLVIVVNPNVVPLPSGLTVIVVPPLLQANVPLQVVEICCGEVIATVTVKVVAPVTEVLYRSDLTVPGVIVAVQLPAG